MSISDDLLKAGKAKLNYLIGIRKEAIRQVCSNIIDETPVLTGALRGSWHTSIETPILDDSPRIDPSGEQPKEELNDTLARENGEVVWFCNALPYSESIEYDGHSQKAPEGMVRKNLAEFPGLVARLSSSRSPNG